MKARGSFLCWVWLWVGLVGTTLSPLVLRGDETGCVALCIADAARDFDECRGLGGTVSECSREVERRFTQCSGERGCQEACADDCLAETTTAYADCLDGGGEEAACAAVAKEVAEACYPVCPTGCELKCTLDALLTCLSDADSAEECRLLAGDDLMTCTEDCNTPDDGTSDDGDSNDNDEDGIPNEFDRCGFNPRLACGTADAGGPYIVSPATGIHLDGARSAIPGGEIVDYSWDLDGDGVFGDATGVRPAVSIAQFLGIQRTAIGLRVTDDRGLEDVGYAEFALWERSFSVDDIEVVEGDEDTREATLTVRLSQPVGHPVSVDYVTADGAPVTGTLGRPFTWDDCGIWRILRLYEDGLLVHADGTPPHEGDFPAWPHPRSPFDSECRFYHWHGEEIDALKGCGHSFAYQPDRHPYAATAGEDYLPAAGTVVFAPGQTEATIVVEVVGDTTFEQDEAFQVVLESPSIGALVDGVGVVRILADGDVRAEDCSDGVDNDADGLVDCDDPSCGASAGCPQAVRAFVRCDVSGDGVLDVSDAVHMVRELFTGVALTTCREAGDCNGDRIRDISDVVFSLAFSFGSGSAPPMPFPECGAAGSAAAGDTVDCEAYHACAADSLEWEPPQAPAPSAD